MSTRESISDNTISPAPSMSSKSNPQYHRLSKVETDHEHINFDANSSVATSSTTRSGTMQVISSVVQQTVADVTDAMIISSDNNNNNNKQHRHVVSSGDDDDDDDDINETDSLVDEVMMQHRPGSSRGGIFRAGGGAGGSHRGAPGSWTPSSLGSGGGGGPGGIVEVPGGGGGMANGGNTVNASSIRANSSPLHHAHSPLSTTDDVDGVDAVGGSSSSIAHNNKHKSMTVGLSASHSSSVEWEDYDDDDDDFDDDDADAVVRRYHHIVAVSKVPSLPAEFSHQRSLPKRIWQSFLELRAAARQRRAARLLTLPSESAWSYDVLQACFMTWCCDATDRGIALVAILLFFWLVIGMTGNMSSTYWWMGILLFTMRVSARRCYEILVRKRHHHGRTHRLSADSMEMSIASSPKANSSSEPKTYRDQSEPRNII